MSSWKRTSCKVALVKRSTDKPYQMMGVIAVIIGSALVPILALSGHRRIAVLWLALELLIVTIVRIFRPQGTWMAARSRLFDVFFGASLVAGLVALAWYVNLPSLV